MYTCLYGFTTCYACVREATRNRKRLWLVSGIRSETYQTTLSAVQYTSATKHLNHPVLSADSPANGELHSQTRSPCHRRLA